ncbi:PEP-CTERM sorting domain-containing protein [Pontiella sp.]|uniref:PEP-CTERM sorting domain-containing protein n=1 Tax=Pontiella sp. TaxID=2837462 RepID=UPI0035678FDC
MKKHTLYTATALLLLSCTATHAGLTSFINDEPGFATATAALTMSSQNFNSFTEDSANFGNGGSLTIGDLTLSGTVTSTTRNFIDAGTINSYAGFDFDGTPFLPSQVGTSDSLTITFAGDVTAFSADFNFFADLRTSYFTLNNTANDTLDVYFNANEINNIGFVSDTPFTTITITSSATDGFSMDNLTYQAIPEPSSMALAGLTCIGAFFIRRSFKR